MFYLNGRLQALDTLWIIFYFKFLQFLQLDFMSIKLIASNRKAKYNYHLFDKFEAGVVLLGSEVKAIREGNVHIKESYIKFLNNELFIVGMYIGEYTHGGHTTHTANRDRKLLLKHNELNKIKSDIEQKGKTIIPTKIYIKKNIIKIGFSIATGKKQYDKRKSEIDKQIKKNIDRTIKNYNKKNG